MSKFESQIGLSSSGMVSSQSNFLITSSCESIFIDAVIGVIFPVRSNILANFEAHCRLVGFEGISRDASVDFLKFSSPMSKESSSSFGCLHASNMYGDTIIAERFRWVLTIESYALQLKSSSVHHQLQLVRPDVCNFLTVSPITQSSTYTSF